MQVKIDSKDYNHDGEYPQNMYDAETALVNRFRKLASEIDDDVVLDSLQFQANILRTECANKRDAIRLKQQLERDEKDRAEFRKKEAEDMLRAAGEIP